MAEEYLFQRMERERAVERTLLHRNDYLPQFVVNLLLEKLVPPEDSSPQRDKWTDEDHADLEGAFLLTSDQLQWVGRVLRFAQLAGECWGVGRLAVGQRIAETFEYPPLELLYILDNVYRLLTFERYLILARQPSQRSYFRKQVLALAFCRPLGKDTERGQRILYRVLQCLLVSHYCNPESKPSLQQLKSQCGEILGQITTQLISGGQEEGISNALLTALRNADVPDSVRERYALEQMNTVLLGSGEQPFLEVEEVLRGQEKYADTLEHLRQITQILKQFVMMVEREQVLNLLSTTLSGDAPFNWEALLTLVTVWLQRHTTSAPPLLKDLLKTLIRSGFESQNQTSISHAFILARHASLVAPDNFGRYELWWKTLFSSESYSLAKSPPDFHLLLDLLASWLPGEPRPFLHVHLSFWPFVPRGCRELWTEYVSRARSRLELDLPALSLSPNNPHDPVQQAVLKAIRDFESSGGKIPTHVTQMIVFSKQHFLSVFLPSLLRSSRNLSVGDACARQGLIQLLRQMGKIPEELYKSYNNNNTQTIE